ncbi:MAG: aromatic-ring-hydroxylating dioxygenase subunit beta [Burkholderiales bacterium]
MSAQHARLQLQFEVDQLNAQYAAALDEKRFDAWPEFFTEDARYTVQARENFDRGLPLALMDLESQGMMKDRVYGITQTIYHGPYYTRHLISPALVCETEGGISAQANYAVFRTKPGNVSEIYQVGRYIDALVRIDGALKFKSRRCVYDSEMVLNSLIYPV